MSTLTPNTDRKFSTISCDVCRIRKVKCDKLHPFCTQCSKSKRECTYKHKNRTAPQKYVPSKFMEGVVSFKVKSKNDKASKEKKDAQQEENDKNEVREIESRVALQISSTIIRPIRTTQFVFDSNYVKLTDRFNNGILHDCNAAFLGISLSAYLHKSKKISKTLKRNMDTVAINYAYYEKSLEAYFLSENASLVLFLEPTFRYRSRSNYLKIAIWITGATYLPDIPHILIDQLLDLAASTVTQLFTIVNLDSVQTLILLYRVFQRYSAYSHLVRTCFQLAASMSVQLGLHLRPPRRFAMEVVIERYLAYRNVLKIVATSNMCLDHPTPFTLDNVKNTKLSEVTKFIRLRYGITEVCNLIISDHQLHELKIINKLLKYRRILLNQSVEQKSNKLVQINKEFKTCSDLYLKELFELQNISHATKNSYPAIQKGINSILLRYHSWIVIAYSIVFAKLPTHEKSDLFTKAVVSATYVIRTCCVNNRNPSLLACVNATFAASFLLHNFKHVSDDKHIAQLINSLFDHLRCLITKFEYVKTLVASLNDLAKNNSFKCLNTVSYIK